MRGGTGRVWQTGDCGRGTAGGVGRSAPNVRTEAGLFVLQNRELQIMRKLEHQNIVKLKYFFYSSGEKVRASLVTFVLLLM